ncbi:hypothetical protein GGX14DRAFT_558863 [Mycena pura]|uniref:Alcohol dehydrogenase-like C-terminal domain-containing protein n=1 Tax=Mycena pura TaxID=153505 RepID=A0AAD6YKM7_9AGAR|nr:hypothetical protein GGX14DRAFT_558863 [Mycena pura]
MGLRVVAIDTGDVKRDLCLTLGAEKWIDFKTSTDLIKDVKEATGGHGPQAVVIAASNPGPIEQAVKYVRSKGIIVIVGVPSGGATFTVSINLVVAKCISIIGTSVGSRQDAIEALDLAARGKVGCHYEVRDFSEVNAVFAELAAQNVGGRIVLKL